MNFKGYPQPNSIGESLGAYAFRTGRTDDAAYPQWHAHGQIIAKAWQKPFTGTPHESMDHAHITIAGGRSFGIRA